MHVKLSIREYTDADEKFFAFKADSKQSVSITMVSILSVIDLHLSLYLIQHMYPIPT